MTISETLARWAITLDLDQVPEAVRRTNALQILDITGVMLAAGDHPLVHQTAAALEWQGQAGDVAVFASSIRASTTGAAMLNGVMAHVMEFDDSHPVSGSHTTTPVLSALISLGLHRRVSGKAFAAAMLAGNEIACRLGMVAAGAAHTNGLHPTGIYGTLGSVFAVARLMELDEACTANALAIAASQCPTSIMASWEDGTSVKSLHAGFAASAAISACALAAQGIQGSKVAMEGRFGFFRSVLATHRDSFDFDQAVSGLGSRWEVTRISSKMYPCGGAFQAHLDAVFDLLETHSFAVDEIAAVDCAVSSHFVPLTCEPVPEKRRPLTPWHARFSMQHALAEAFVTGRMDHDSFAEASLSDPRINALADQVNYYVDEEANDRQRLLGEVRVRLKDGRTFSSRNDMRGTERNPAKAEDYLGKFRRNAGRRRPAGEVESLARRILDIESAPDVTKVFGSAGAGAGEVPAES